MELGVLLQYSKLKNEGDVIRYKALLLSKIESKKKILIKYEKE